MTNLLLELMVTVNVFNQLDKLSILASVFEQVELSDPELGFLNSDFILFHERINLVFVFDQ